MDAASRTGIALVGAGALAGCVVSRWLQRESASLSDVMVKEKETPSGSKGTISLVGAGPGDPGLLTLQAVAELRAADLLITDKLTKEAMGEQRMRALLKPNCVLSVARNKRSKKRGVNVSDGVQDEINEEGKPALALLHFAAQLERAANMLPWCAHSSRRCARRQAGGAAKVRRSLHLRTGWGRSPLFPQAWY